jgi:hypothetical protein
MRIGIRSGIGVVTLVLTLFGLVGQSQAGEAAACCVSNCGGVFSCSQVSSPTACRRTCASSGQTNSTVCSADGVLHHLKPVSTPDFTHVDFLHAVLPDQDIPFGQKGFFSGAPI